MIKYTVALHVFSSVIHVSWESVQENPQSGGTLTIPPTDPSIIFNFEFCINRMLWKSSR